MIEFIRPLHNWLQQFTNHYLTHRHLLPTGHSAGTILTSSWTLGIVSSRTTAEKTNPLPSNGCPTLLRIRRNVLSTCLINPHRQHLLQHLFYCCVSVLQALPSNGSTLLLVEYLLRACLPSRCLAMGMCVTICCNQRIYMTFSISPPVPSLSMNGQSSIISSVVDEFHIHTK
jgi:hypothetical protein